MEVHPRQLIQVGPCKVSIKPRRAERGDLNSWLTFATKSALTCSIRLVLVTSERTIMAQTGLFAFRSGNRHILTSKKRPIGLGRYTSLDGVGFPVKHCLMVFLIFLLLVNAFREFFEGSASSNLLYALL